MHTGLISPHAYRSPEHQQLEFAKIFKECWIFAGLKLELGGISHLGVDLGSISLLLQCDRNGIPRAYLNVCSHRHAQLCEPGQHTGTVRCPYHGWVYDREGVPVGVPQKQCFFPVIHEPQRFRLTEFACETVGQFIFVRLSDHGPSLRDYLGNQYDFLERSSKGMTSTIDEFQGDVDANWKVVVENALEGYHVPAVHSATFMQTQGMDNTSDAPHFFLDDKRHSHLEHAANPAWIARFSRMERRIGNWPWRFEHYTHHLIFPNLTVTSFMGYSFHVQRFDPITIEKTRVHSRTVGVNFTGGTNAGFKMMGHIHADGHAFTKRVFAEDGEICRKVQAGLRYAIRPAILGVGIEDRVAHFHQAYADMLEHSGYKKME